MNFNELVDESKKIGYELFISMDTIILSPIVEFKFKLTNYLFVYQIPRTSIIDNVDLSFIYDELLQYSRDVKLDKIL